MSRSKIIQLADFEINGAQIGEWFSVDRVADSVGALQIVVDLPGNVTAGSLLLLGRADPSSPGSAIHNTFTVTTLQASSTIEGNIKLAPQMSVRMPSGTSAPAARVQVYLMT